MVELCIIFVYLVVLALCGIVADYILPRIKPLERWLETLPQWEDDEGDDGPV